MEEKQEKEAEICEEERPEDAQGQLGRKSGAAEGFVTEETEGEGQVIEGEEEVEETEEPRPVEEGGSGVDIRDVATGSTGKAGVETSGPFGKGSKAKAPGKE